MKNERHPLRMTKVLQEFHQSVAILSAILETLSCGKPNLKLVQDINEYNPCMKFEPIRQE